MQDGAAFHSHNRRKQTEITEAHDTGSSPRFRFFGAGVWGTDGFLHAGAVLVETRRGHQTLWQHERGAPTTLQVPGTGFMGLSNLRAEPFP